MARKRLVIIDGYSLLFRAFYGSRYLSTSAGRPTNALYGFVNMLFALFGEIKPDAVVVALDETGQALTSAEFAGRIGKWRDGGTKDICFVIGGADGLDKAVLERAQLTLSFGRLTWPHLLVRVLLVEQIFRAQSILQGHPYHRE